MLCVKCEEGLVYNGTSCIIPPYAAKLKSKISGNPLLAITIILTFAYSAYSYNKNRKLKKFKKEEEIKIDDEEDDE